MKIQKMKYCVFLFFFVLSLPTVKAQSTDVVSPNSIKIGIGPTLFGYGDIRGIMQITEYRRQLLPYLQVGAGLSLAQASSTIHRWQQAAAKTLDFNIAFIPLHSSSQNFKIGVGVSGRHLTDIYSIGSSTYDRGPTPIMIEDFEKQEFNSIGYTALLEYEYLFGERWAIGTRASFQNYRLGSTVLFLVINGGIWF
jgi:hypothetical protein